jgi:hypothetical protein
MAGTTIHRSNRNLYASKNSNFLYWAERHPKEAWEQAIEEPWKLAALRRDEGEAARATIRAFHLDALKNAEAKLASLPKVSPARRPAQLAAKAAHERYAEVESALRPRPRRR